jgi:hypothetical protein
MNVLLQIKTCLQIEINFENFHMSLLEEQTMLHPAVCGPDEAGRIGLPGTGY